MRKIVIVSLFFVLCGSIDAFSQQVFIGTKEEGVSSSAIIEFPDEDTRGIVLSKVSSEQMSPATVAGTLIYDLVDNKIKYKNTEGWVDLSINSGAVYLGMEEGLVDIPNARTLIGAEESDVEGVLVLESNSKAMVLPRVDSPHLTIVNPPVGTLVYDTKDQLFCVFNGKEWTFWSVSE